MSVSITVDVKEGVFVYGGVNQSGRPIWAFNRRRGGNLVSAPTPKRWKSILKAKRERARKEAR